MEKDRYTPKYIKSFEQRSENKKGKRRNAIFADNGHTVSKDGAKRGAKGYDGGKKIKGRKRAIIVDTLGLIHAVHVCSANEHDTKLAEPLLEKIVGKFPRLRKILADRGFSCDNLRRFVTLKLNALLEIKDNKEEYILKDTEKSVPLKGFQVIPHRWIVERTNAWNIFYRRLAKDYEHNPITSQALIMMSAIKRNLSNLSQKPLLKET